MTRIYEKDYDYVADRIPKFKVDPKAEKIPATNLYGTWHHQRDMIYKKEAWAVLETYPAGAEINWAFAWDEVAYVLEGRAEITYTLLSTRHAVEKTMTAEPGDCFLIPLGARLTFKIDPSGPFEHLCVIMPAPRPYRAEFMPEGSAGAMEEIQSG